MAPEVFARNYTQACDLWSCGIIMYEMLGGAVPFRATTDEQLAVKIATKRLSFQEPGWINVKQHAMDM
eukprot:5059306-Amphidinium_carterae.1